MRRGSLPICFRYGADFLKLSITLKFRLPSIMHSIFELLHTRPTCRLDQGAGVIRPGIRWQQA